MRPLIGITTRAVDKDGRYALSARYVTCVNRAGGNVVLLPPESDNIATLLDRIDGLIFSGGGDISSDLYGGLPHQKLYGIDINRDRTEISAVKYAIEYKLPLLGICRGIQIMNVALGGTLIEHIPDLVGEAVRHRLPEDKESLHAVRLMPNSLTARIFGKQEMDVPSFHHQAIRKLAPLLKEVAHSQDGIIEAVELPEHPFFIGVQWHPELSNDPLQQQLFNEFI
ncbi:MAG: gamma-glutamyl-gamma-aminobutyrate hydrolase family protein [Nitrospirae bacterium]|nr:gamma-glutamyl-gamma-aminobutyrate hydrolase family protein [Candidatus Troglogloeales bacterium]